MKNLTIFVSYCLAAFIQWKLNLFNFLGDSKRLTKLQKVDYFESLVRKFSKWSPEKLDYFTKIDYLVID